MDTTPEGNFQHAEIEVNLMIDRLQA
ncbi:uncharacterized protein G2W53_006460 [Senna tora]|uniref:Uncharacterized protein n=1 Tax=Senna tora TaxID=362788 RepID=A0A834X491_9FABA|nr:uncharacterized protein G2W53_006460 [Senna tora]